MTDINEIAPGLYRISTFVEEFELAFNQYLFVDDQPLLYHAGMRGMFPAIRDAIATVMDPADLRWVGASHFESDEVGGLNEWLSLAPSAQAVCTKICAMVNLADYAIRPPHPLGLKDWLKTGRFNFRMRHTAQLPHGWDAGMLFEETTGVLLCSDLFHHNGPAEPLVKGDPLPGAHKALTEYQAGPLRNYMPYTPQTRKHLEKLAEFAPATLAAMHGPAFVCDGREALLGLADVMDDVLGGGAQASSGG